MQAGFQAQMTGALGLHRTTSRISVASITSFAASINTKRAYKKLCKKGFINLGVTAEMINQNEREILSIFKQNAENDTVDTSLHLAARGGHRDTVKRLLSKGASTEAMNIDNETPLHCAVRSGSIELLLEKGALIEARGRNNTTPLHLAA